MIHLADAADVADHLWNHFVATSIRRTLAKALGGESHARSAVVFSAAVHDVGKLTPSFARKATLAGSPEACALMQRAGLKFPLVDRHPVPHATAGHIAIERWLHERLGITRGHAAQFASAVGGHHGVFPSTHELTNARQAFEAFGQAPAADGSFTGCPWHIARTEILDRAAEATGAKDRFGLWKASGWPIEAQMMISGIVILADWLASDSDLFPYYNLDAGRVEAALAQLRLPSAWSPQGTVGDVNALFASRFPSLGSARPTPLQRVVTETAASLETASLLIIEAPMGAGKTEAAFMASEAIAGRRGAGGVFFGLPTMATANPMFNRTLDWLDNTLQDDASVNLAHSKAGLHERFAGMVREARVESILDEGSPDAQSKAVVASWLLGRKRSTHANFVVGTVDQLLLMALRAKHISLRHVGMAGKVVVIDECHAADDYMRVYLCRALTWLARTGVSVILMSATLPPQIRQQFADAYAEGLDRQPGRIAHCDAYPRLTVVSHSTDVISVEPDNRRLELSVLPLEDDVQDLGDLLERLLRDGGCAAVIQNTVARAQATFEHLTERFGDDVILLHSRFIAQHRAAREDALVSALGRNGARPRRCIVVGTQVLEQSLDIDVDVMVSDLAPMDLLLQRAGRLHRHHGRPRPPALSSPVLYVTGADFDTTPPLPDSGSAAIYGAAKLLRCASLLMRDHTQVSFPSDIPRLVGAAYASDLQVPPGWEAAWEDAELADKARVAKQQSSAASFLVRLPGAAESLVGATDGEATDPESANAHGKRQVRDAEETLEVIVLQRSADGALRLPVGIGPDEPIPEYPHVPIPHELARAMAATTLSLPLAMTRQFDAVEQSLNTALDYSNWDRSPWLKGQLALVLDARSEAHVAGFHLHYDPSRGLVHSKENPAA